MVKLSAGLGGGNQQQSRQGGPLRTVGGRVLDGGLVAALALGDKGGGAAAVAVEHVRAPQFDHHGGQLVYAHTGGYRLLAAVVDHQHQAAVGLQAPHRLTPLHLLQVEVEAYLRHVVSAIHGESIAAVGSSGYIPFPADLTDAPVILKHLRRVGFAVVAEQDPSAGAPLHIDIQALCVDELEVVHMAAPSGGVGPGIFDRKGNIPGGVDGE